MKISNTRRIAEKVAQMRQDLELSDSINDTVTYAIEGGEIKPRDLDEFQNLAEKYQQALNEKGAKWVTADHAKMAVLLDELLTNFEDIFADESEKAFVLSALVKNSKIFDNGTLFAGAEENAEENEEKNPEKNPSRTFSPYQLFIYASPITVPGTALYLPRIGCFRTKTEIKGMTPIEAYSNGEILAKLREVAFEHAAGIEPAIEMTSGETAPKNATVTQNVAIASENETTLPSGNTPSQSATPPSRTTTPTLLTLDNCTINSLDTINDGDYNYIYLKCKTATVTDYLNLIDRTKKFKRTSVKMLCSGKYDLQIGTFICIDILYAFIEATGSTAPTYMPANEEDKRLRQVTEAMLRNEEITLPDQVFTYFKSAKIEELIRG